jgi:hypothetical protein
MECKLNRMLNDDETVDHKDDDFTNDVLSNLQILPRIQHAKLDVFRIKPQTFTCQVCQKQFILSGKKLNDAFFNRKKGCSGPFCSKSCAGKATHGKFNSIDVVKVTFTNKSLIEET